MSDFVNIEALADALAERLASRLPAAQPEPFAYTIKQAAERLNLGESTVRKMIDERELKCIRRGTRILIPRQVIIDWLNQAA